MDFLSENLIPLFVLAPPQVHFDPPIFAFNRFFRSKASIMLSSAGDFALMTRHIMYFKQWHQIIISIKICNLEKSGY